MKKFFIVLLALLFACLFTACGGDGGPSPARDGADAAEDADIWSGDWYGWWRIHDTDGGFALLEGDWHDVCAVMSRRDGTPRLVLWDESSSAGDPLGTLDLVTEEGAEPVIPDELAEFDLSLSGFFFAAEGEAVLTCADPTEGEEMLVVEGAAATEAGGYAYTVYLRPWGALWQDVTARPYAYESWYLPLIREEAVMPSSFVAEEPAESEEKEDTAEAEETE